jgi:hypothetical protein
MDLDVHLDAIVAGDDRAFAAWLAGAEPLLRHSLRSFATTVDVEVVLQETLLRAWQFAPRVTRDGGGNSLLRYALRTGRNLAIDHTPQGGPPRPGGRGARGARAGGGARPRPAALGSGVPRGAA